MSASCPTGAGYTPRTAGRNLRVASGDNTLNGMVPTLKRSAAALRDAGIPYLVAGGVASWVRGGPSTDHDLDFLIKPSDADRSLEALADAGLRPERPPEEWLYKAWDGEVLVDLIFEPRGLEVTDEVLERGETVQTLGISMPLMAIEDVLATKLLALDEHDLDYSSVLQI